MTTAKSTIGLVLITLAACLCGGCVSNPPPQPVQSVDLDRYAGKWYRTLTFRQTTTIYRPTGAEFVQTWHEALRVPGTLRIDTDSVGGGVLYSGDSIYTFANGRLVRADTGRNDLLVLGFDVYRQPVERSAAILRSLGFDLGKFHATTWDGKPVYVVGALAGDTASKQFWVTRDDLLFVRMLQTQDRRGSPVHREVRFEQYVPAGGGWVATEVVALTNGRRTVTERYADLRTDVPLADDVFEPSQWSATRHWMR